MGHRLRSSLLLLVALCATPCVLRANYALGVRYLKLTHNTHTDWADSAAQLPPRLVRSRPAQARGREPAARAGSR